MSMRFETNPSIIIDLDNGCYSMGFESGNGKSYLKYLLCQIAKSNVTNCSILAIDAIEFNKGFYNSIMHNKYDLIIVDRFALNPDDELCRFLLSRKDEAIVLVDCKDLNLFEGYLLELV